MTKKNKDKKKAKPNHASTGSKGQFRDLTAERYYDSQMQKATRLCDMERFDEALDILEPLTVKYPKRGDLFEFLGVIYTSVGAFENARDAFLNALQLDPLTEVIDPMIHYSLAQMYVLTGFPLLAYEQTQMIDMSSVEPEHTSEVQEFRRISQESVDEMAAASDLPQQEYLRFALPLERGHLALQKGETEKARTLIEKAATLAPKQPAPANSLVLLDIIEKKFDQAIERSRQVLDNLDSQNLEALVNLTRAYLLKGDQTQAGATLERIRALPRPEAPEDVIKMSEAFAILDDDKGVFELIEPLLSSPTFQEDIDEESYEEAFLYGLVSAAHLEKKEIIKKWLSNRDEPTQNLLLERTEQAVRRDESGPRTNGRFYYFSPAFLYPSAIELLEKVVIDAVEEGKVESSNLLQPFFDKAGPEGLDIVAFQYWTSPEPEVSRTLLEQLLDANPPGCQEVVERLAFTRAGSDLQRLLAAETLLETGRLKPASPVQIWADGKQNSYTPEQLRSAVDKALENETISVW